MCKYEPVFLAGKYVYRIQNFKRGVKNSLLIKTCAGIVSAVIWCPRIVEP
nr:MAG TPA: hypothetical protein [Caudoviricetes sp.]